MTFPRVDLIHGPTPLEPLTQLSNYLDIDLWVKRDDLAGVSFGGNKSRQLEYYLGAAKAEDADVILITGAVQSNFVRTAAAYAAKLGMKAIVQLEDRVPDRDDLYANSGNVLLSRILGAEVVHYPVGEDEGGADKALYDRAALLKEQGRRPYVIPLAMGKPPLGALGYQRGAAELIAQDDGFDAVVVASGSGMTHSGMVAGFAATDTIVHGSCVRRPKTLQYPRIHQLLDQFQTMTGEDLKLTADDVQIWDDALAPGYGQMGPLSVEAMRLAAELEGMILDPVYTAKSFAGVIGLVRAGVIEKGAKVAFVNTGGLSAFFAYQQDIELAFGLD